MQERRHSFAWAPLKVIAESSEATVMSVAYSPFRALLNLLRASELWMYS